MFYPTDQPHGLERNPFNALVLPRPIGWISTVDRDGRPNLAPYSFFNACAYHPPQVMFSTTGNHERGGAKDSIANIEATGELVVNLATWALREAVNASSIAAPHGFDEMGFAGLTPAPSRLVRPPRVAQSPAHLECMLSQIVTLESARPDRPNRLVVARVVGIHIDDAMIRDGRVDARLLDPIARLGYDEFARLGDLFELMRPAWPPAEGG